MSSPGNGASRFHVHLSGATAVELRRIQSIAANEARGKLVIAALREIVRRLESDPYDFGEPTYNLPALNLQLRIGFVRPLSVDFAVNKDRLLVFIRGFTLLPP